MDIRKMASNWERDLKCSLQFSAGKQEAEQAACGLKEVLECL